MNLFYSSLLLGTIALGWGNEESVSDFYPVELSVQYSAEEAVLRERAYRTALEAIALEDSVEPDFLEQLNAYPDQTFAMFDGCFQYWGELYESDDAEMREFGRQQHYDNFPGIADMLTSYRLNEQESLVSVPCWLGPYWLASVNYLWTETASGVELQPVILPELDVVRQRVIPGASNLVRGWQTLDLSQQQLTIVHRYSGAGNCGHRLTYIYLNTEGDRSPYFHLMEFHEQPNCEGSGTPEDYPRVYP